MLVALNNFNRYPASPIPESLISGIPLFYLPPKSNRPVLASKNTADQSFALYWRQICLLGKLAFFSLSFVNSQIVITKTR